MRMSPGLWLWLAALLHPRPAHAAVNEYVLASSPPGRVDGASVHFTDQPYRISSSAMTRHERRGNVVKRGLDVSGVE